MSDDLSRVLEVLARIEQRLAEVLERRQAEAFEALRARLEGVGRSLGLFYVEMAAIAGIILGLLIEELVGPDWMLLAIVVGLAATAIVTKRKGLF